MKKTIYVPDEETWGRVKDEAEKQNKSISSYLLDGTGNNQLDRIEKKLDEAIRFYKESGGMNKPAQRDKFESHKPKTDDIPPIYLKDIKQKVKKAVRKKQEKPTWSNPLAGTTLAPKK